MTIASSVLVGITSAALAISASCQTAQTGAAGKTVVPQIVKYNGVAVERSGDTVEIVFRIYSLREGGEPIWSETQHVPVDRDGNYSVLLGSSTEGGLPPAVFAAGQARWLAISIERAPERERIPLASVAYAMKAADAETLGGLPATDFVTRTQLRRDAEGSSAAGAGPRSGNSPMSAARSNASPTGSGTAGDIPVWTSASVLGNSLISQKGAAVTVKGSMDANSTTVAAAVAGTNAAKTGVATGVLGRASSPTSKSVAVSGVESATTGTVFGVTGSAVSTSPGAAGVSGAETANTGVVYGVIGNANSGTSFAAGVLGNETGPIGQVYGVWGKAASNQTNAAGVNGSESATTGQVFGVNGAAYSTTDYAAGVNGFEGATIGLVFGVDGNSESTTTGAAGVRGYEGAATGKVFGVSGGTASPTTYSAGVSGYDSATTGVVFGTSGTTSSTTNSAAGVDGFEGATTGAVYGVAGTTSSVTDGAAGVYGSEYAATGLVSGVSGAVNSTTLNAAGVSGWEGATTGQVWGVSGVTFSAGPNAAGVNGYEGAASSLVAGVRGSTQSTGAGAAGVFGWEFATTGQVYGLSGESDSTGANAAGVYGTENAATGGVFGVLGSTNSTGPYAAGVQGYEGATSGVNWGVIGNASSSSGIGVQGGAPGIGVAAFAHSCDTSGCSLTAGTAGEFVVGQGGLLLQGLSGPTGTTSPTYTQVFSVDASGTGTFAGDLNVTGKVTKGSGSFKIDDPLDPAHKYLSHSFVESPDMMNVYNGNVTTDRRGLATVTLPGYFEALNRDFRYQLTVIGQFAQAIVAKEIDKNRFVIRTSKPGVKVSWQVTGIRQDAYANAHRIPTEEDKPTDEQGYYLHPELFGQPVSRSVSAARAPATATATHLTSR